MVHYIEKEETSRKTNFTFFGLDLVEIFGERMDLHYSFKNTNLN